MGIDIAIVGGGPGGLMTARRLEQVLDPSARITLFEAGGHVGGKLRTRNFVSCGAVHESGIAECYDYRAFGPDPLHDLVRELGLTAISTDGRAMVFDGRLFANARDLVAALPPPARRALGAFVGRAQAMLPADQWARGSTCDIAPHPWSRCSWADILATIGEPQAERYVRALVHSDLATEPHRTSGLVGLRMLLRCLPGYGRHYTLAGGMSELGRALAAGLTRTHVRRLAHVVGVQGDADAGYRLRVDGTYHGMFDAVVLALPLPALADVRCGDEALTSGVAQVVARHPLGAHYLRVSALFDRPFWRRAVRGSWFLHDAFGGCCIYDESPAPGMAGHGAGVLGWLLAGDDAERLARDRDDDLVTRMLEALPPPLDREAREALIEARVHRWTATLSAIPGGTVAMAPRLAHRPAPNTHPAISVVGDYLFDSSLNGLWRSAGIAASLVRDACMAPVSRARKTA